MNHFLKLTRTFSHYGLPHTELGNLEFYVEIMCALANKAARDRHRSAPPPTPMPISDPRLQLRLAFFRDIYAPRVPPTNLLNLNPVPADLEGVASPEHAELWDGIISVFPSTELEVAGMLRVRAEYLLHHAHRLDYYAPTIDYAHARWTHHFPDHRARALFDAHYVLLVSFCRNTLKDGRFGYVIQGTVHPSQRSTQRHYPRISFAYLPPPSPFALDTSQCSCEDGYAARVCNRVAHSATEQMASVPTCRRFSSLYSTPRRISDPWYVPHTSPSIRVSLSSRRYGSGMRSPLTGNSSIYISDHSCTSCSSCARSRRANTFAASLRTSTCARSRWTSSEAKPSLPHPGRRSPSAPSAPHSTARSSLSAWTSCSHTCTSIHTSARSAWSSGTR